MLEMALFTHGDRGLGDSGGSTSPGNSPFYPQFVKLARLTRARGKPALGHACPWQLGT